jgi:NAD(P)-dependent dehydrogenase (short-subunit alcohol dehydrogenase family)
MQLKDKVAVINGAGGAIGGAVARTFAREGAKVFLSGRTLRKVERGAREIVAAGGTAEAFQVDAVESQVADASGRAGFIFDILIPGHVPLNIGLPGPVLRVLAVVFSGLALHHPEGAPAINNQW